MGEKYKITGQMLDKIISMRNDQIKNYTYREIKEALKEIFKCDISINAIRLAYLKNQNRIVNKVEINEHKTVKKSETLEAANPADNGLRAKAVTNNEKLSLLDELKSFN